MADDAPENNMYDDSDGLTEDNDSLSDFFSRRSLTAPFSPIARGFILGSFMLLTKDIAERVFSEQLKEDGIEGCGKDNFDLKKTFG